MRIQNFRLFFTIAIVKEDLLWIPPNHEKADSFIKTLELSSFNIILETHHLDLPIPKFIRINVCWRVRCLNYLTNYIVIRIIIFLILLNGKEELIDVQEGVFRKIHLLHIVVRPTCPKIPPHLLARNFIRASFVFPTFFNDLCCQISVFLNATFCQRYKIWIFLRQQSQA